ncbi:YesK family protein [Amycolatopsis sp. w19]
MGGWTGMGEGAICFTAFISSLISLIIISVVEALKGKVIRIFTNKACI